MPSAVRILYVEDDEGSARLLQKRLSRLGFTVDTAPNGDEGLRQYELGKHDVVIVDHNMPGLSGLQIMRQLAQLEAAPITVMLTGTGNEMIAVEAMKLGASDYLVKDIDGGYIDLLPAVIEQSLRNRQLLDEKRRAEEALEQNEKYYHALIDNSLDLIVLTDSSGLIRYVSPSFRTIFGQDESELIGQNGMELVTQGFTERTDADLAENTRQFYSSLKENPGKPYETEIRVLDQYGIWRWLEVRGKNLLHEPWIEAIVLNVRDISDRKQAEEALRESEGRFRMLFEEAPDPYFTNDLAGNLLDCNRAAEALVGMSRQGLIGKNFADMNLFAPDQLEEIAHLLARKAEGEFAEPFELTIDTSDRSEVVLDLHTMPIQVKGQTQLLGLARDITWRKKAEAQLRDNIEKLEILHQLDNELTQKLEIDHVLTIALDSMVRLSRASAGSIEIVNGDRIDMIRSIGYLQDALQHHQVDERSIVGRVIRQKKAELVLDVAADSDYVAVRPSTCSQITLPLLSQDLVIGIVNLEADQPDCFNNEIFGFLKVVAARVAVALDNAQLHTTVQEQLNELQVLYAQVSRLEQLKTDMIRIAAHDLGTPIASVLTSVYLLRRMLGDNLPEKPQHTIENIDAAAMRMRDITASFLSLDRIDKMTAYDPTLEEIDIAELTQNVFASPQFEAQQKEQIYELRMPESPLLGKVGRAELQQAITNLIGNAIKYTPPGGRIEVILERCADNSLKFEVMDTGYGIPADQQRKLFQPFFRAQMDETLTIAGTGLGLYLVKKMIERGGGHMIFHSEYGKGSTFGFELPLKLK